MVIGSYFLIIQEKFQEILDKPDCYLDFQTFLSRETLSPAIHDVVMRKSIYASHIQKISRYTH